MNGRLNPKEILNQFEQFCRRVGGSVEKVLNTVYCVLPEDTDCYVDLDTQMQRMLKISATKTVPAAEFTRAELIDEFNLDLPKWTHVTIKDFATKSKGSGWLFDVELEDMGAAIETKNEKRNVKTIALSSRYGEHGVVEIALHLYG